jgi:hypothetical protein
MMDQHLLLIADFDDDDGEDHYTPSDVLCPNCFTRYLSIDYIYPWGETTITAVVCLSCGYEEEWFNEN